MVSSTKLNGALPGNLRPHIGHTFSPHRHVPVDENLKPCSGRWWCEKDKVWITGPKCHEK